MTRRLALTVILASCLSAPAWAGDAGGYTDRKVTDKDVVKAANFAMGAVKKKKITGGRVLKAQSQVVAGTNYKLDLQVFDRSSGRTVKRLAQVVVYQNLDNKYEVTSWKWQEKKK